MRTSRFMAAVGSYGFCRRKNLSPLDALFVTELRPLTMAGGFVTGCQKVFDPAKELRNFSGKGTAGVGPETTPRLPGGRADPSVRQSSRTAVLTAGRLVS